MNSQDFSRLRQEQKKAIAETNEEIAKWEKFKSDYVALKSRLKTLPDKVTHDVMVPFGKLAFMPGNLVHTNEILVLLGDNWFAERSAKQAAMIVDRRLKDVEKQLKDLQEQKKILIPRLDFTQDLQRSAQEEGVVDIREDFDEEKEKQWKEQHRKRVQEQKRKDLETKRKLMSSSESHKEPMSDEQLWARLDELERIETEKKELQMLGAEEEIHLSLPKSSDEDEDKDKDNESPVSSCSTSEYSENADSEDEPVLKSRITFTHSKVEEKTAEKENSGKIVSPRDIYRQFCEDTESKSILKSSEPGQKERVKKKVKIKEDVTAEESRRRRGIGQGQVKDAGPVAFSGTVVEKSFEVQSPLKMNDGQNSDKPVPQSTGQPQVKPDTSAQTDTAKLKRVSKFKADRQKKYDPP